MRQQCNKIWHTKESVHDQMSTTFLNFPEFWMFCPYRAEPWKQYKSHENHSDI